MQNLVKERNASTSEYIKIDHSDVRLVYVYSIQPDLMDFRVNSFDLPLMFASCLTYQSILSNIIVIDLSTSFEFLIQIVQKLMMSIDLHLKNHRYLEF